MTPMIDRADSVAALTAHLPHQRFITVVGPGGIGKTTVALAVARRLAEVLRARRPFRRPRAAARPCAWCRARSRPRSAWRPAPSNPIDGADRGPARQADAARARQLRARHRGGCRSGGRGAAPAPGVQILATSREPLRVEGEHVHRLPPLACPPASARLTAAQALGFPAVQLFVERAAGELGRLQVRRRGGFAGRRHLPQAGRRAARHRAGCGAHRRLRRARPRGAPATIVSSCSPADADRRCRGTRRCARRSTGATSCCREPERAVLRRLAIFAGGFTLEAASVIAASVRDPRGRGRPAPRQPGHEVADRGRRRRRRAVLPAARHHAGLRAREALRQWRARPGQASPCGISAAPGRRAARSRPAGGMRPPDR